MKKGFNFQKIVHTDCRNLQKLIAHQKNQSFNDLTSFLPLWDDVASLIDGIIWGGGLVALDAVLTKN